MLTGIQTSMIIGIVGIEIRPMMWTGVIRVVRFVGTRIVIIWIKDWHVWLIMLSR